MAFLNTRWMDGWLDKCTEVLVAQIEGSRSMLLTKAYALVQYSTFLLQTRSL